MIEFVKKSFLHTSTALLAAALLSIALTPTSAFAGSSGLDELTSNSRMDTKSKDVIKSDFNYLESLIGSHASKLSDYVFKTNGRFDGMKYAQFFYRRVSRLQFGYCANGATACAGGYGAINLSFGFFRISRVERLSLLLHEARHLEPGGWNHEICPRPFLDSNRQPIVSRPENIRLAGLPACDSSPLSAYGIQIIFYRNLAENCENCTAELKSESAENALRFLIRIINKSAQGILQSDY